MPSDRVALFMSAFKQPGRVLATNPYLNVLLAGLGVAIGWWFSNFSVLADGMAAPLLQLVGTLAGLASSFLLGFIGIVVTNFARSLWNLPPLTIGEPCRSGDCLVVPVTNLRRRVVDVSVVLFITGLRPSPTRMPIFACWNHTDTISTRLLKKECRQFCAVRLDSAGDRTFRKIPCWLDDKHTESSYGEWDAGEVYWGDMEVLASTVVIEAILQITPRLRCGPIYHSFRLVASELRPEGPYLSTASKDFIASSKVKRTHLRQPTG
jgi:hypothetical protein